MHKGLIVAGETVVCLFTTLSECVYRSEMHAYLPTCSGPSCPSRADIATTDLPSRYFIFRRRDQEAKGNNTEFGDLSSFKGVLG